LVCAGAIALLVGLASGDAGDVDTSFGTQGVALFAPGSGANAAANALRRDPSDGSLTVTGRADDAGFTKVLLARFVKDGTPDRAVNGGAALLNAFGSGTDASGQALAIDQQGRIVVAGQASNGGHKELLVARYKADGSGLDTTGFNSPNGYVLLHLNAGD